MPAWHGCLQSLAVSEPVDSVAVPVGQAVQAPASDADHVLTRFQTSGSVNYMNFFNNELNMHERHFDASPPLHLQKLTFQFLRSDGTLIDFNGFDHGLHMRVIYDE